MAFDSYFSGLQSGQAYLSNSTFVDSSAAAIGRDYRPAGTSTIPSVGYESFHTDDLNPSSQAYDVLPGGIQIRPEKGASADTSGAILPFHVDVSSGKSNKTRFSMTSVMPWQNVQVPNGSYIMIYNPPGSRYKTTDCRFIPAGSLSHEMLELEHGFLEKHSRVKLEPEDLTNSNYLCMDGKCVIRYFPDFETAVQPMGVQTDGLGSNMKAVSCTGKESLLNTWGPVAKGTNIGYLFYHDTCKLALERLSALKCTNGLSCTQCRRDVVPHTVPDIFQEESSWFLRHLFVYMMDPTRLQFRPASMVDRFYYGDPTNSGNRPYNKAMAPILRELDMKKDDAFFYILNEARNNGSYSEEDIGALITLIGECRSTMAEEIRLRNAMYYISLGDVATQGHLVHGYNFIDVSLQPLSTSMCSAMVV